MKLTAQLQLRPTLEQADFLKQTLEAANAACNVISAYAYVNGVFSKYDLQKALYAQVRAQFKLGAQVVIRCLGKVADAYKPDKATQRTFQPHGAVVYNARILHYYTDQQRVSIWSVARRAASRTAPVPERGKRPGLSSRPVVFAGDLRCARTDAGTDRRLAGRGSRCG